MKRLTVSWTIFTDARTTDAARRVGERVLATLGFTAHQRIEPYPKTGGHKIFVEAELELTTWPEVVLEVIERAQRVGRGWMLHSAIREEVDLQSNDATLPGVTMLLCRAARPADG